MAKLKTHKASMKRVKVAGGKKFKLMKKVCGQNHFNAREPGKVTRMKRHDICVAECELKGFKELLPYQC